MDFSSTLSDITSGVSSVAGSITDFASGIGGPIMKPEHEEPEDVLGKTRLRLGDVEFTDFELPESIETTLQQRLVKHDLVGGVRVIDAMGATYDPISWSASLVGVDSGERDQLLKTMAIDAQELVLSWDIYAYKVVISSYKSKYLKHSHIDYTMTCEVLEVTEVPADDAETDLAQQCSDDVGEASELADEAGEDGIKGMLDQAKEAINSVQDFAAATVQQVQAIITPIVQAQQAVQGAILRTEAAVNKIVTLGGLFPGNPVAKAVHDAVNRATVFTRLPLLYRMQEVVGRTQANLSGLPRFAAAVQSAGGAVSGAAGNVDSGVKTVTQAGGDLYQIAADEYGDLSLWPHIAAANGMTDPQLTGITTVQVPDKPPANSNPLYTLSV